MKVKRDDEVMIISGKDRGKRGRVIRVDRKNERVYVDGLNIIKRHQRPQQAMDQTVAANAVGGVIERPGPIHVSNVALLDPKDHKPTRIGVVRENGKRFRVARRSQTKID